MVAIVNTSAQPWDGHAQVMRLRSSAIRSISRGQAGTPSPPHCLPRSVGRVSRRDVTLLRCVLPRAVLFCFAVASLGVEEGPRVAHASLRARAVVP